MAIKIIKTFKNKDNFVFIPACCYNGNSFESRNYDYPPMFKPEESKTDMPTVITDIPRLNPDGSGKIEVTTGDAATPCIGVFSPSEKRAILVFTVQEIEGKNIGLAYENGDIRLTWPAKRERVYFAFHMYDNTEAWVDEPAEIPTKILEFPCESMAEFYRVFFENRKIMGLDDKRPEVLPFDRQFEIQKNKFNTMNWNEKFGMYAVVPKESPATTWQIGWVGGGMSGLALMQLGGELEAEREMKTLDFIFSTQTEFGLFRGVMDANGNFPGDGFGLPSTKNTLLIRRMGDMLVFFFKHFKVMKEKNIEIPKRYVSGTKKLADALVSIFERYGQFGQFVDCETGEIIVGGSASGAITSAGLAEAYAYFKDKKYLSVAKEAAEYYYQNYLTKGYTTGGPGEILQCVDSESAFGLLESFVVLFEKTGEDKWLEYAKECLHYCSTWVVSYNYRFPKTSEFGRYDLKSVGSVFANIQNKHSAPGICTLSGDSIYKVWKWTKNELYLELVKDIALTISQYMSTEEKPIYDWDITPEEREAGDPAVIGPHKTPSGFINERVNLSDWEGAHHVGGVFYGSCWSETSNLLTLAETIPYLV